MTSVPPPPTRRRGSVLDDAIMRDMLSTRVAPAEGVEDDEERERMERMYVMLRWSKKYRQALVRDANASWEADTGAASSSPKEESSSSSSYSLSDFNMSARRSSMSTGSFGAGRLFAASELDAALADMATDSHDSLTSSSQSQSHSDSTSDRQSLSSLVDSNGLLTPTTIPSLPRGGVLNRKTNGSARPKRHVRFADDVTTIPASAMDEPSEGSAEEEGAGENDEEDDDEQLPDEECDRNPAVDGENLKLHSKSLAVRKLKKAFKRAFLGTKPTARAVHAAS